MQGSAIHDPRISFTPSQRLFASQRQKALERMEAAARMMGERPAPAPRTRPYSPSNAFRVIAPAKPETPEQWISRMSLIPIWADQECIAQIVADIDPPQPGKPRVADVLDAVSRHYNITVADLKSRCRNKIIIWPRHVAVWLAYKMVVKSYPKLSLRFTGKDHTSLLNSVQRVEARLEQDTNLRLDIEAITADLKARIA